jgi:formylglycine-generating enzyme required for sulfatase activity
MSLNTDRSSKFLFGCLIVVLCWIIGAGQLLNNRSDNSPDYRTSQPDIRQVSSPASNANPWVAPSQWAINHTSLAFCCFLTSVIVWVISVVVRQMVVVTRDSHVSGQAAPSGGSAVFSTWGVFDLFISLVILASAGAILARGLGWLFALLIVVTAIVCFFLALGPQKLADYFRSLLDWLDARHSASMVNGDLPLGKVNREYGSPIILPPTWWQAIRQGHAAGQVAPMGVVLFGVGAVVTVAMIAVLNRSTGSRTNRAPTLLSIPNNVQGTAMEAVLEMEPIPNREVEVGEQVIVTPKISNPSVITEYVQFSITPANVPGARFHPDSGLLIWTPTEPGTHRFSLYAHVPDGTLEASEATFTITVRAFEQLCELADMPDQVVKEGDVLTVSARIKDRSRLDGSVRYNLASGAPDGSSIDAESGVITWPVKGAGMHRFTVQVTVDGPRPQRTEKSFNVSVQAAAARAPEIVPMSDRTVKEGEMLHLMAQLKTPNLSDGTLQFRLGDGAPKGATIDPDSGLFSWRPSEAGTYDITILAAVNSPSDPANAANNSTSFRVVVTAQHRPPVIARIDDRTVNEGEPIVVPVLLKNAGNPQSAVRFRLCEDSPAGAEIDPESGVFAWIPEQPGTFPINVHCESLASKLSDQISFTIVVSEHSAPPELAEIGNKIVRAGESLVVPIKITSVGRPTGQLAFAMTLDSAPGAQIDPRTGILRWNVAADTPAGEYPVTVRARNAERPALTAQVSFQVTVLESGQTLKDDPAPAALRLVPLEDQTVDAGTLLRFVVRPHESGLEIGDLEFSLAPDAPLGAFINERTGLFTWRPSDEQAMRQFAITVRAHDVDNPRRSAETQFLVKVNSAPSDESLGQPVISLQPATQTAENLSEREEGAREINEPPSVPAAPRNELESNPPVLQLTPDEPLELKQSSPHSGEPEAVPPANDGLINSIGIQLMPIPTGFFLMGSHESPEDLAALDEAELLRFRDEQPPHPVRITKPFFMGNCEVTVGQFKQFVDETGYATEAERGGGGAYAFNSNTHEFEWGKNVDWRNPGWTQTLDHPVVNVSWNDAMAFCKWLSEKEARNYRLPTEAEWEYACRAGTQTRYSTGDTIEDLASAANLGDESFRQTIRPGYSRVVLVAGQEGPAFTTAVGKFVPNSLGLHDMHGNVFEWCKDFYAANYYQESPLLDPTGPATGTKQVIRGGSFFNSPFYSRSSFRNGFPSTARVPYLGFRVVLEAATSVSQEMTLTPTPDDGPKSRLGREEVSKNFPVWQETVQSEEEN